MTIYPIWEGFLCGSNLQIRNYFLLCTLQKMVIISCVLLSGPVIIFGCERPSYVYWKPTDFNYARLVGLLVLFTCASVAYSGH